MRVLVVDDNANSLQSLCLVLSDLGHSPTGLDDPMRALDLIQKENFHLVITDIRMPGMDGLELLSEIKDNKNTADTDVVLITGHGDMTTAVEALRRGAYDYLNKPINARELAVVVDRCAERQSIIQENVKLKENLNLEVEKVASHIKKDLAEAQSRLRELEGVGHVIAESDSMQSLLKDALILHGDPSVSVLIEGETGTGKEIFARYIHYGEGGVTEPFIAINCSAIPSELFESELFGHEAGSFTGSREGGATGKFEQAGKGTIFLDEIAEMPLTLQPKLLRVLEDRSFYKVGGDKKISFKARVVCAGNRDMYRMVEKGSFRRDLYHRLRVGHIVIPPLRDRETDIMPLAQFFLKREAIRKKKNFSIINSKTEDVFMHYPWPGNVRELENAIERAVLMNDAEELRPEHVSFLQDTPISDEFLQIEKNREKDLRVQQMREGPHQAKGSCDLTGEIIKLPDEPFSLAELELRIIESALEKFEGNKSRAAKFLGISRFTLHRRLKAKEN